MPRKRGKHRVGVPLLTSFGGSSRESSRTDYRVDRLGGCCIINSYCRTWQYLSSRSFRYPFVFVFRLIADNLAGYVIKISFTAQSHIWLEDPQFTPVPPPLPDNPRGISETPMVRVPATASLLRAFQPRSSDSFHSVYSGLRPIYATQSHPQTLNPAHIQSLRDAKLRSGSEV